MDRDPLQAIRVDQLRIGMFIHLDVGWLAHPFPFGKFKIKSQDQIDTIRSLGLTHVRMSPALSDGAEELSPSLRDSAAQDEAVATAGVDALAEAASARQKVELAAQQASLERCEHSFRDAAKKYRQILKNVYTQPASAAQEAQSTVHTMFSEIGLANETAIRLLSEKAGEESALHALNVTVLSLLLARACSFSDSDLLDIGVAALLHDIGKLELPDRLRWCSSKFSAAERRIFEDHALKGRLLAENMGLAANITAIIAEHHERDDGSGYPGALTGSTICPGARIVALVNQYDNYCNPDDPAQALTPHDALAVMFAKMRTRFDAITMSTFIRMMGVYPPGSAVQLTDSRYALSVSVNASRPLKPRVMVYDESTAPEDALIINLESMPDLGVRRSLKPSQLPRPVFDYLSPRKRMCYFFEYSTERPEDEPSPV